MAAKEKESTPKESIQQEDEHLKDKQQPATPIPPQRTDPNAAPTSDEEEEKEKE